MDHYIFNWKVENYLLYLALIVRLGKSKGDEKQRIVWMLETLKAGYRPLTLFRKGGF